MKILERETPLSSRLFILLLVFAALSGMVLAQTYLYSRAGLGVGNKPSGIALADLNGDGRLDVAVANESDNSVSVVLSRSDGSFAPKVDYLVGTAPVALVSGDFNGDHIPDLAVVNSKDNTVSILLGVGDGTFNSQVTYPTGTLPVAIVTADFNGDKKLDLAIANQDDGTVTILLGNGDGTFQPQATAASLPSPNAIASGDFNGDGAPDLVVLNAQGSISLWLNNGSGGFPASGLAIGASDGSMAIGDLNNDGNLDIVFTSPVNNDLVSLLGNGSGGFQSLSTSMSVSPMTVTVGDFNGDGKLDLAVGSGTGYPSSISILLGNGNGTYQQPLAIAFTGTAALMAAGDFNNDNYSDLAAVDTIDNQVTIFLGSGSGSIGGYTDLTLPASGGIAGSAADFNGDGKLDVAVAQFNQNAQGITGFIAVLPGKGDGTFKQPVSTPVSNIGIGQMVVGDFNGDGKVDVATAFVPATGGISVVLGNGDGTFGNPISSPVNITFNVQDMIGGDFNNDGKADLALLSLGSSNTFSPLYVLLSNGDGTFQPNLVNNVPGIATSLAAGDFNGDGNLDIAVTDPQGAVNPSVLVFLGRGDGTFASPSSYSTETLFTYDVKAADFNGDGKVDLAVGTDQGIFFFAGKGDGTFQLPIETPTYLAIEDTVVGDFNGDGKPDLAVAGLAGSKAVALGNGDGTFQTPVPFQPTYYPRTTLFPAGDFNGDGSFDLVQFSASNTMNVSPQTASVWLSTPTVTFSTSMLDFGTQNVGTSSTPESIMLNNEGNAPLSITKIATTGSFAETNNCTSPYAIGQGCTINVTFTPTANGASNGSLTFGDNSGSGAQVLALTGWAGPPDFSSSVVPSSQSVTAGSDASYNLTLASGGGFSGTVQLACTGAPSKATCALSKSSVVLDGSSAVTVRVTVTTTAPSVATLSRTSQFPLRRFPLGAFWLIGLGLGLGPAATLLLARKYRTAATIGIGILVLALVSCGGGNSGGGGGGSIPGTPPGTYNLTISGTSGNLSHNTTIGLTVE